MPIILDWCSTCKHIRENIDGWIMNCDAFPEEIPSKYVYGDPRELEECNNGIKYEPIADVMCRGDGKRNTKDITENTNDRTIR